MDKETLEALDAYELISREELPDIHAEGVLLRHKKSGARVVLIPCGDENKVFSIAFRTPPADSTGVAHIIEHTVLCGSREFPLKDPFVELIKGSLNTFLNALTYPDKTMYPVASTNAADFHNLMHVYLDAVFHPNIYREENIFRQEGWHYEMEDASSPLTVNGVVYNEMKGVFSSPDSVLERETMNALFPEVPYGVESGGDPKDIPKLSYSRYLDFHRRYYHPSNSYLYLYGDVDMEKELRFIDRHYLADYERQPVDSGIPLQKPFPEMRRIVKEYPVTDEDPTEGEAYLSYSAVAGDFLDMREMIAFDVLDYALFSAPGAPVRQALLDAGIGTDVYGEFEDGIRQPYFSVVAKHAKEEDADRFLSVIRETLAREAEKGIDRESLNAGINYLEFQFREADFGSYPRGLMYGMDVMDTWLYDDAHPFDALRQLDAFDFLKKAAGTGYFEELIRKSLLDNPHSALVILRPKRGLMKQMEEETASALEKRKAAMSADEIKRVVRETRELKEWQETPETPEHVASLPVLKRSDLKREIRPMSNRETNLAVTAADGRKHQVKTVFHDAETNGIDYVELLFDVHHIPAEEVPYLGLLKSVLLNVDAGPYSYLALNNEINAETGGISCGVVTSGDPDDPDGYQVYFGVQGKALHGKTERLMDLIREVTRHSRFDDSKRIREIITQTLSQLQAALQQAGHTAAANRACAYEMPVYALQDAVSGIGFERFLSDLADHFDERSGEITASLTRLAADIFVPEGILVSVTAEQDEDGRMSGLLGRALEGSAEGAREKQTMKPLGKRCEGFTTAGQVQFVAMAGNYMRHGYAFSGVMQIVRQILSFDYLWQNVRVKGGAYGCGGSFRRTGDTVFTSFRDPHVRRTREVFEKIPDYLASFRADEKTMTKYIIGTMSGIDQPMTPATFGLASMRAWMMRLSDEERQRSRSQILDAREEDVRSLAGAAQAVIRDGCFCVIGGEQAIGRAKDLFGTVEPLL